MPSNNPLLEINSKMELNKILFPAPPSSYTLKGPPVGHLIFIPRDFIDPYEAEDARLSKMFFSPQFGEDEEQDYHDLKDVIDGREESKFCLPNSRDFGNFKPDYFEPKRFQTFIDPKEYQTQTYSGSRKLLGGYDNELEKSIGNEEEKEFDENYFELSGLDAAQIDLPRQNSRNHKALHKENPTPFRGGVGGVKLGPKSFIDGGNLSKSKPTLPIPCLYLPSTQGSSKVMLFFHRNAEDIGSCIHILDHIRSFFKIHIVAMEYPGYGVYPGTPDAGQINIDAELVYDYLTKIIKIPESNIIIFGRCIGSGPAIYLAARKKPSSMVLMSAFRSIKDIAKEQAGKYLGSLMSDRFRNIDLIERVTCPTLFIHGKKDTLIGYLHSSDLYFKCGGPAALVTPANMDHHDLDLIKDFIQPLSSFLSQCNISIELEKGQRGSIKFPKEIYKPPKEFPRKGNQSGGLFNWILRKFM